MKCLVKPALYARLYVLRFAMSLPLAERGVSPLTLCMFVLQGAADVENMLKEMKSGLVTPLTAIAATPRKESVDPKFNFDPSHAVAPLAGPRSNPFSTVPLGAPKVNQVQPTKNLLNKYMEINH